MKIATYRKTDGIVFWVHNSGDPALLEPVWREDFAQQMFYPLQSLDWYDHWASITNQQVAVALAPADSEDIRLWRSKVQTLNWIGALVNNFRQRYMPPLVGQESLYNWMVREARAFLVNPTSPCPTLEALGADSGMNVEQMAHMVEVRDTQCYGTMVASERVRQRLNRRVQEATLPAQLSAIREEINVEINKLKLL